METLNWIRLREDNTATAFGPYASHLILRHRQDLDALVRNWKWQDKIDAKFTQVKYVRNSHFVFDQGARVRAAGTR